MKILVICQYYAPEPFRVSDICESLVQNGHSVTVVAGLPNYPMGMIYDGYRHGQKRDEIINGVKVHRCFTIGRRQGFFWRFMNYYSYAVSSTIYCSKMKEDFDVVLVNQLSPVMMAKAGIEYKKKKKKKLLLYCLDLWPESLIAGNISRSSFIYKFFHRVSSKIYRQADALMITSHLFSDYFIREFGIQKEKIRYLPQYAEALFTKSDMPQKDGVDLMFAGNIGAAQSVKTILYAAKMLEDCPDLRFHIIGDGSDLQSSVELAERLKLKSVTFHGRKSIEEMPAYYERADAMLITMMDDPVLSLTLPGKIQTYMAAGKPVIGAINGETETVIQEAGCGYCTAAEDSGMLADSVRAFCRLTHEERAALGRKAYHYYNQRFHKDVFIKTLEKQLKELM